MKLELPDWLGSSVRRWVALAGLLLMLGAASVAATREDLAEPWAAYYDWVERVAPEHATSQALLDFRPILTEGDSLRGLWPPWLARVFKVQGEWAQSVSAWYVPAGESGKLMFCLDRTQLQENLIMEIEFFDGAAGGSMFVDLVDSNEEVLLSSQAYENGNLIEGSEEVVTKSLWVPLEIYPEAAGIQIRGEGEVFLLGGTLSVPRGSVVATGEKEESDSRATRDEYAPSPALPGGISGGISGEHDVSGVAKAEGASPGLSARTTDTISLKQFVMLRMADTSFIITRDALVGAGGRMNSPNFILEGSFAQGMAIGFSADNIFRMNAGFQQNEAEQLEFWNVSVLPAPFQGPLRRFNPSLGEIANFSYELSTEARSVTVRVLDQAGLTVRTLVAQQRQNRGLHTVAWNGTNAAGNLVPDNRKYTFALNATNNDGAVTSYVPVTVNEVRIEVVTNIPVIRSVADQPEPFVPADGLLTISYETTAPAGTVNLDMTVEIFADSLAGPRVWWRDFNNQAVGNNSVDWDGTDDSGQAVPDGLYVYSVRHRAAVQDRANPRSGAITLRRLNTQTSVSADGLLTLRYAGQTAITITPVSPGDVGAAMYAIRTAEPGQTLQSLIYRLAPAGTSFTPPALMAFEYPAAIVGDIGNKLQIRRFNNTSGVWEPVAVQIVDSANTQIVAEITTLSLYALFAVEQPPAPPVLEAIVRLEPEALNVNPGILTAFVSLPAGYPASGITSATCDGALYERMMLSTAGGSAYGGSDDGTEMIIKFRRRDIEAALAEIGETIDVYFVIEGAWQSETGISYSFEGADSIMKIIGGN